MVRVPLPPPTSDLINAVCPGTRVDGAQPGTGTTDALLDPVWGPAEALAIGYAADPEVRFRASTGGVLTALGQFLLNSERVSFVLHVSASTTDPMRTVPRLSFDSAAVLEGQGRGTARLPHWSTFALSSTEQSRSH